MTESTNTRVTDPHIGVLNVLPVGLLVVFKVLKLTFIALRGIVRSLRAERMAVSQPKQAKATVRTEPAPSKLKDAADEPPARVIRRSTGERPAPTAAAAEVKETIWQKKPSIRVADRHAIADLSGKQYRFSVYLAENEIQRFELGRVRKPLSAFTRSMAASEGVAFTLEEAIEFTRRELAAARRRGPGRKTESRPITQSETTEPPTPAQRTEPPSRGPGPVPLVDEEAPNWMDIPCFDELSSEASNHRPTSEVPPVAEAESVAAPRAQPPIQRDPPPPLPDTRGSGGDELEEGPVDFRGARRAVGKVVTLGEVVVRPEKKKPYQIYAITLKDGNGDEQQFRGYELAQHVENNMVRLGDTISLKRGRQQFWVTRAGVRTGKQRNIYDFQVVDRARR
ncbi:hypothetical protein [Burkholderia contaminans]|uniref:hypothetical protein n=1 Tax=Burkholderia contaminans TaxID=488447 RepID=UPI000D00C68F|nr:hypothetical protein [Burkholderia contaminans]PRD96885.1 hypothetical protein C6P88_02985 [Burkholderia contaminans]